MIVLDGRNDREKLNELLVAGEQTRLDYKETLDLTKSEDKLHIVKDIVTLSNRPGGGYLVIGANDNGKPCVAQGTLDRKRFDGANLGQLVRGYIDGQIHLNCQVYDIDGGYEVIVVQVNGHSDGMPVPMSKLGQYHDGAKRKDVIVFREGEILLREGPANVILAHRHWNDLLAERDKQIRAAATEDTQALIAEVVKQFREGGGPTSSRPPLTLGMSADSFADSVLISFESGNDIRMRRFLEQARQSAISPASELVTVNEALDRIAELAALALLYEREEEAHAATDKLYDIYLYEFERQAPANTLTAILARVYAIGSLAVRLKRWSTIHYIMQKPVSLDIYGSYTYSSWLRHGQVEGSRSNVFSKESGGLLVSMARDLVATHSSLRPDVTDDSMVPAKNLDRNDELLNSLCQFDFVYCLITVAEGEGQAHGYPTCAAFQQTRTDPILERIANDSGVRAKLFPKSSNKQIAEAMTAVFSMASNESAKYGSFWSGLPPAAALFAQQHWGQPTT